MSQQEPAVWNAVAPTYAEDVEYWTPYALEALRSFRLSPMDRVLDNAAGPGTLAFQACSRVTRVDAVDFAPAMVKEIKAKAEKAGIRNIDAAVMDAQKLSFKDETFEAAYCMFAFFFFPDRAKAFKEMLRVLKPGGRACIVTWAPIEKRPLMKTLFDALAEATPEMPLPSKGDLQTVDECAKEMRKGGFKDVSTRTYNVNTHVKSADHFFEMMERSAAPIAMMKQKLGADAWAKKRETIVEAIKKRVPGPVDLGAEAIYTVGTRD